MPESHESEPLHFDVRLAREDDADGILELWGDLYRLHRRSAPEVIVELVGPAGTIDLLVEGFAGEDRTILVAESRSGEVLGVILVTVTTAPEHPLLTPRTFAVINDLVVSRSAQRHGVGEALVESAEEWAKARGVHEFEAEIYEFNAGAASFYEEMGYRTVSHIVFKRE